MTRLEPTDEEIRVKSTLIEYLKSKGKKVRIDDSITDSPDCGFFLENHYVKID